MSVLIKTLELNFTSVLSGLDAVVSRDVTRDKVVAAESSMPLA